MSSLYGGQGMASPSGRIGNKIPSGYKQGQLQQFTPEQMSLFQQMFGHVSPNSFTSKLASGDQSSFEEMEAPALRQFNELQGGLSSRFSGMGSGARRSSGFQNTVNQASSDFAQNLSSKRQELQRQALQDLMGLSGQLLGQRPYEQFLIKKQQKKPFWQQLLGMASPIGGDIASGGTENTQNFFNTLQGFGGF